jgi:hypothetical protein
MLEDTHDIIAVVLFGSNPPPSLSPDTAIMAPPLPYLLVFLLSVDELTIGLPILAAVDG